MLAFHNAKMRGDNDTRLCANSCGASIRSNAIEYCSQKCRHGNYRKRVIALWKAGMLPPRMSMNRVVRSYLFALASNRCQRCGWGERNPYTGRLPLEIEHVDGDWRNDAPGNLLVLCPNCHALTATFKGANRGRGRPDREHGAGNISHGGRLPLRDLEQKLAAGNTSIISLFPAFARHWTLLRDRE
jgi:hypothetical protein